MILTRYVSVTLQFHIIDDVSITLAAASISISNLLNVCVIILYFIVIFIIIWLVYPDHSKTKSRNYNIKRLRGKN